MLGTKRWSLTQPSEPVEAGSAAEAVFFAQLPEGKVFWHRSVAIPAGLSAAALTSLDHCPVWKYSSPWRAIEKGLPQQVNICGALVVGQGVSLEVRFKEKNMSSRK